MGVENGAKTFWRSAAMLLVLGALVVGTGCGGRRVVVAYPGPNTANIVLQNYSGVQICFVQFSPTSDRYWGPDRLGAREVIHPGMQRIWHVVANYYDYRLLDCHRRVLLERRRVALPAGQSHAIVYR